MIHGEYGEPLTPLASQPSVGDVLAYDDIAEGVYYTSREFWDGHMGRTYAVLEPSGETFTVAIDEDFCRIVVHAVGVPRGDAWQAADRLLDEWLGIAGPRDEVEL